MEPFLQNFGYAGLFIISFLAATLIPLGSEAAVILMALTGFNPGLVLLVASAGNSLGSFTNYFVGKWGGRFIFSKYIKVEKKNQERAEKVYGKWGSPVLFFAWLPILGDPITVVAGLLKVNLFVFAFWVVLGKALRYLIILKSVGAA